MRSITPLTRITALLPVLFLFLPALLFVAGCSPSSRQAGQVAAAEKPDESFFDKVVLAENLDEPIALALTPAGQVIFVERYGNIKRYDPEKQQTTLLARLPVNTLFSHGLLGVTLDPDFTQNHWIYFYYSPLTQNRQVQRVSRFQLQDDKLLLPTEQVILEIPVQREYHGHDGGALAFGPDGNLYISVGDNTSPFIKDTQAPMDETPGRQAFDAQRTALNTNDLNGKILRIRPLPQGGYAIPEGNLFPKGTPSTRPEIYVMGCRNPFRIALDQKTGFLYWGNIGGVDELHQVRQAGLYGGWPYFYGDNQVYEQARALKGGSPDPKAPVNNSPNNTGLKNLPPCRPAFLWYNGEKFPLLGSEKEGMNIMAGPVYYADHYPSGPRKFPDYYHGKIFIYDWVRNWIMAVTVDARHDFKHMEPFMPSTSFSRPIDMTFGPDGAMYLLEYGAAGYAQNADARLVRIDYTRGNRRPVAHLQAARTVGAAPLTVQFSAARSFDYDKADALQYVWRFTGPARGEAGGRETSFTFDKPGVYDVQLVVTDPGGAAATAATRIKVGNEPPQVRIRLQGNQSFYFDHTPLAYEVAVQDREDGTLGQGIAPDRVAVSFIWQPGSLSRENDFTEEGAAPLLPGKALIAGSDCGACHLPDKAAFGPAYAAIARRYAHDPQAPGRLARKVIAGGGGNWPGGQAMAPHAALSQADALKMVDYILSLARPAAGGGLPLKGSLTPAQHLQAGEKGAYLLSAVYTDQGGPAAGPLTGRKVVVLQHPQVEAEDYHLFHNIAKRNRYVDKIRHGSYIAFQETDLTGISRIAYSVGSHEVGGTIELRLGSPTGQLISTARVTGTGIPEDWREELYSATQQWTLVQAPVTRTAGIHDLYFVFKNEAAPKHKLFILDWIHFQP